jgi:hypothetical protein
LRPAGERMVLGSAISYSTGRNDRCLDLKHLRSSRASPSRLGRNPVATHERRRATDWPTRERSAPGGSPRPSLMVERPTCRSGRDDRARIPDELLVARGRRAAKLRPTAIAATFGDFRSKEKRVTLARPACGSLARSAGRRPCAEATR